MDTKQSRESFYSKRAVKARKHEEKERTQRERKDAQRNEERPYRGVLLTQQIIWD